MFLKCCFYSHVDVFTTMVSTGDSDEQQDRREAQQSSSGANQRRSGQ